MGYFDLNILSWNVSEQKAKSQKATVINNITVLTVINRTVQEHSPAEC